LPLGVREHGVLRRHPGGLELLEVELHDHDRVGEFVPVRHLHELATAVHGARLRPALVVHVLREPEVLEAERIVVRADEEDAVLLGVLYRPIVAGQVRTLHAAVLEGERHVVDQPEALTHHRERLQGRLATQHRAQMQLLVAAQLVQEAAGVHVAFVADRAGGEPPARLRIGIHVLGFATDLLHRLRSVRGVEHRGQTLLVGRDQAERDDDPGVQAGSHFVADRDPSEERLLGIDEAGPVAERGDAVHVGADGCSDLVDRCHVCLGNGLNGRVNERSGKLTKKQLFVNANDLTFLLSLRQRK
jgi:hypothetical protein